MLRVKFDLVRTGTFATLIDCIEGVEAVELDNAIYQENDRWIESLTVSGGAATNIEDRVDSVSKIDLFELESLAPQSETHHLVGFVEEQEPFVLSVLSRNNAIPHRLFAEGDRLTIIAVVRDWTHLKDLGAELEEQFEAFELLGTSPSEQRGHPLGLDSTKHVFREKLTEKQLNLLETAFRMGYFEVPQQAKSEEVASELDISQPTFSERLRRTENKMFSLVFGESLE